MIWVLAGTSDSYHLICDLQEKINIINGIIKNKLALPSYSKGEFFDIGNYPQLTRANKFLDIKREKEIIVSVVSDYGKSRLSDTGLKVISKKLNKVEMVDFIKQNKIELIIDATHPFASNVSENAIKVSKELAIEYLRYERPELDLSHYPAKYLLTVYGYQEAVEKAQEFERIFLTIGSNNLNYFTAGISKWEQRLIARVLPDWKFIKKARSIGFTPSNLLAIQGPFSFELNKVLLKEFQADVLVSKASGKAGGLDTKIKAAIDLKIPVIIIRRSVLDYPIVFNGVEKLIDYISSLYNLSI
ncbi:MAG: precorrin-6A reductase [bacterium]